MKMRMFLETILPPSCIRMMRIVARVGDFEGTVNWGTFEATWTRQRPPLHGDGSWR
jgi:hypothetical protein